MNLLNEVHIKTYQGFTNAVIADALNISNATIKRYRKIESPLIEPAVYWYSIIRIHMAVDQMIFCYETENEKTVDIRKGHEILFTLTMPGTWDELCEKVVASYFPECLDEYTKLKVELLEEIENDYNS